MMVLTKKNFREMKTALMGVEGNPGSAKLGETIARGFKFPDYHAMKSYLDDFEGTLNLAFSIPEVDEAIFWRELEGLDAGVREDLQNTFTYFAIGPYGFEELTIEQPFEKGRIRLDSLMSEPWRAAAAKYLPKALESFGALEFRMMVEGDYWSSAETDTLMSPDIRVYMADEEGKSSETQVLESAIYEYEIDGTSLHRFLLTGFLRGREFITGPLQKNFSYLVADKNGIRAVVDSFDEFEEFKPGCYEVVLLSI